MRKSLIFAGAAVALLTLLCGCSAERRWGDKERRALREEMRAYRDMAYLDNLAEAEFEAFTGDVVEAIEVDYPIYTTFIELPGRGDTVEVYVVSTIVEQLNTNPHNLRNIFPYPYLVSEGILPAGLNHQAERAFYECLAYKVNRYYPSTLAFYEDIVTSPTIPNAIVEMEQACAADLFDWGVEIDETIVVGD